MRIYTNEELTNRKRKKQKSLNKIRFALVIIISIGILYNVLLIIQSILYPNKTPSFLGYKTFSIISGSMMPEINVGDIVVVKDVEINDLKDGDIISFRNDSEIITHRIIRIEEDKKQILYITKGDNNNTEDADKVSFVNIEGKVVNVIPKLGNVVFFLKNKVTILLLITLFILIYVYDMKKNSKKMLRKKKREYLNQKKEE